MTEDEFVESLPPKLRRRVLQAWSGTDTEPESQARRTKSELVSLGFVVPYVLIGLPFALIGFILTLTVLFAPVGIPLMVLSCVPARIAMKRHDYSKD